MAVFNSGLAAPVQITPRPTWASLGQCLGPRSPCPYSVRGIAPQPPFAAGVAASCCGLWQASSEPPLRGWCSARLPVPGPSGRRLDRQIQHAWSDGSRTQTRRNPPRRGAVGPGNLGVLGVERIDVEVLNAVCALLALQASSMQRPALAQGDEQQPRSVNGQVRFALEEHPLISSRSGRQPLEVLVGESCVATLTASAPSYHAWRVSVWAAGERRFNTF